MTRFDQSYSASRPAAPATTALHGPPSTGARRQGPLVGALVQSTTFHQTRLGEHTGPSYSRVSNPTVDELEAVLGALEDAPPAVAFGTGLAAETALFLALLAAGDHAVLGEGIYGGTTRLFRQVLTELGISSTFVDATDVEAIRAAIVPQTRLVFVESPANPTLKLTDLAAVARVVRAANDGKIKLVVDNTFLTPVLQRPLELGADVSVYSTTKLIEGHSTACGGAVVARDPTLLERVRWLRKCTGGIQAPFNSWLTSRGVKTLPVRIREQSRNALHIATFLASHPDVVAVHYPGLPGFPQRSLAEAQHLEGLHGNVVSFEVRGGARAGKAVLEGTTICSLVEHVGSVETLLTHPATMTHADVPPAQREAAGITDGLIRLSVGLEEPEELVRDLDQAIRAAHRVEPGEPIVRPLLVLKLGGSVLCGEEDLERATHEIYGWVRRGYRVAVVVSAMFGVTDQLLAQARRLCADGASASRSLLAGTGELTSASLLGLALERGGLRAAVATPWQIGLYAEGSTLDATPARVSRERCDALFAEHEVVVVPGFVAQDDAGHLVLLGRGGSDLSALFLAHQLGAARCRLVKDVDGLYQQDPARVTNPGAAPLKFATLSWAEARKLDGGIVQPKALRAAEAWRLPFEVGAPLSEEATRVGDLPVTFAYAHPRAAGDRLRVTVLGCGTVGAALCTLLHEAPDLFELVAVADRDPSRAKVGAVPGEKFHATVEGALATPCDVVVELLGGVDDAYLAILEALRAGRCVVTANKAVLAARGDEPALATARARGRLLGSASVGGAAPILEALAHIGQTEDVVRIEGILNGTTNAVLELVSGGAPLAVAVARAQELGLAEADVGRDLSGSDVADKLVVLASALGETLRTSDVVREEITASAVANASRRAGAGEVVRYLACLERTDDGVAASVRLAVVPAESPVARVRGAGNRVTFTTSSGRQLSVGGRGAGGAATAHAVFQDLFAFRQALSAPVTRSFVAGPPANLRPGQPQSAGVVPLSG